MLAALELACFFREWSSRSSVSECARGSPKRNSRKRSSKTDRESRFCLESVLTGFKLSNDTLRQIMTHMNNSMNKGLKGSLEMSTMAMLPSFVPELPDGTEHGKFVAIDLGGTNLRILVLEIEPGQKEKVTQYDTRVPHTAMTGTGEQLFDYVAKKLADFLVRNNLEDENLPVGFTFSYPCHQTSLRNAALIRWTKGFTATGVEGEDVVELLEKAIERDGRARVEIVAVLNDTVGTMVAGAYEAGGGCDLGIIIGTGTNAAYMEDSSNIVHGLANASEPYCYKQMVIDTEWGAFGDRREADYFSTEYDELVDRNSDHPGEYTFDKLIAGMYLGELVRLVLVDLCTHKLLFNGEGSELLYTHGSFPTKFLSEILSLLRIAPAQSIFHEARHLNFGLEYKAYSSDEWGSYSNTRQIMDELDIEDYSIHDMLLIREVCLLISQRSAHLSAAATACVLNRVRRPKMTVAIDGSTYKYHPFYEQWLKAKVLELLDPGLEFKVIQTSDGSGKGAALIAAIVTRLRRAGQKPQEEEVGLDKEINLDQAQITTYEKQLDRIQMPQQLYTHEIHVEESLVFSTDTRKAYFSNTMFGALELACVYRTWNHERRHRNEDVEQRAIKKDIKKVAGKARLKAEEFCSLESVMAEFKLSNNTLRRMMSHMSDNMDRGLEGGLKKSTIAMLPSFVPELPDGTERGKYVAMDLGGTNLRVMIMEIEPGEKMRTKQFNTRMPNAAMHGSGTELFDYIAKALADFLIEKDLALENLPVGFTFSYPCDQTSLRSATLLRWTKGVTATGVVGNDVVKMLEDAIARDGRIQVQVVAMINDTVGTMVAAAYEAGECDLGVIIGTGTNASYMENSKAIIHGLANASEPYEHKQMIIDTEWGGFGDRGEAEYIFTQYDKIIDERSDHPGINSLDKLVAGMCMGEIVRLVLEKLCTHKVLFNGNGSKLLYTIGSFPTKYISEILHDDCGSYSNTRQIMDELGIDDYTFSDMLLFREVCLVVSRRSANLSAAAIACVLNRVRRPKMVVAIDGSTYKYHPFFDHWVVDKIKELIDPGLEFKIVQTGDGSGKGAALIAAIVTRVKRAEEKRRKEEEARRDREATERELKRKAHEERLRLEAEEREREKQAEEERARKLTELLSYGEDRVKEEQNHFVSLED